MVLTDEDRTELGSDLISNALVTAEPNLKLETALIRFLTRIDQNLFFDLLGRHLFIIDGSNNSSLAASCRTFLPSSEQQEQSIDIIFLSKFHMKRSSQKALLGVIAHEFAHMLLGHTTVKGPVKGGHGAYF